LEKTREDSGQTPGENKASVLAFMEAVEKAFGKRLEKVQKKEGKGREKKAERSGWVSAWRTCGR